MKIYLDENFNPVDEKDAFIVKVIPENNYPFFIDPQSDKKALDDEAAKLTLKTYDYYGGRLDKYARDYYNGVMDDTEFLDKMIGMIDTQLHKAWYEGMRENGLAVPDDFTDEMESIVKGVIDSEYNYVTDLADFINAQRQAEAGLDAIYQRLDMWQIRYTDMKNQAIAETAKKDDLYEWVYGDTVEHCTTCSAYAGVVATMAEWEENGKMPQSSELECGGWRCQCTLQKTDKPATEGGIPSV